MAETSIGLTPALTDYLRRVGFREPEILTRLRAETTTVERDGWLQVAPEQGAFLAFLVEILGARKTLEIGVFTGYSTLAVALVLPPDGEIVACDINEDWTAIARCFWQEAGVADKIDLRIAPALDTLEILLAEGQAGSFDFAFIDADKENNDGYYEAALRLVRPGGVIAIDNVLRHGRVVAPPPRDVETEAVLAFNAKLHADPRVSLSLVPIGDGMTLARRRPD